MTKVQLRENFVAYHATKQQRKAKVPKALLMDKEQEVIMHDQSRVSLTKTIKNVVTEFPPEARQEYEDSAAKVS